MCKLNPLSYYCHKMVEKNDCNYKVDWTKSSKIKWFHHFYLRNNAAIYIEPGKVALRAILNSSMFERTETSIIPTYMQTKQI